MRSNSGSGKSQNNLHDPTLKEAEAKRNKSGQASMKRERSDKTAERQTIR